MRVVIYRNQSFSFTNEMVSNVGNNRVNNQNMTIMSGNGVSFPVMSSFHQAQNQYLMSQEIGPLQPLQGMENQMSLFTQPVMSQQGSNEYLLHRLPQRPSKRPRRYFCQYIGCHRSFDSQWALERHIRIHTGEKPFACLVADCGKCFTDKCALKRHQETHNPTKPFKCNFPNCSKCFKTKGYLDIHIRLHTEQDPYRCIAKGCNRSFSSPKSLKRHEIIWHNVGGGEPTIEHTLREKILRLQNRYREKVLKLEIQLKRAASVNRMLKKQRSELRKGSRAADARKCSLTATGMAKLTKVHEKEVSDDAYMTSSLHMEKSMRCEDVAIQTGNSQSSIAIPLIRSLGTNDNSMEYDVPSMDGQIIHEDGMDTISL